MTALVGMWAAFVTGLPVCTEVDPFMPACSAYGAVVQTMPLPDPLI